MVAAAAVTALSVAPVSPRAEGQAANADAPLAALAPLVGAWRGGGTGYSTTLRYAWLIEGHVLGASNEVANARGDVVARYHGSYAWDAGRKEIVFWVASQSGEVHQGRAWWREGVLWHEASVSGGRIEAYASAIRPVPGRLEYFAAYGTRSAAPSLLETTPILYTRVESDG